MPLISSVLATNLASMTPVTTEIAAIQNFATAFTNYFQGASVNGVPCLPGTLSTAQNTMVGAMTGMSNPGAGAAAITTGITAFWGVVAATSAVIWPAVPFPATSATPPPGLAALTGALTTVFTANSSGNLSLTDAANAIATAIHSTQLGGIAIVATTPTPTPSPIL